MHPVQGLRPGPGDLVPAVAQQPQHHQVRIGGQLPQSGVPQRDHDDRMRIGGIGLEPLAGARHPRPGRQLRRHIQHPLAVGEQPLGHRAPDPVRALHRPDSRRPLPGQPGQLTVTRGVSAEPARGPQNLPAVPGLDRDRQLVGNRPR